MGQWIELAASDGARLSAYRAETLGRPRGALVIAQEIFGVNSHIRSVCDGYADEGYVAIAPALFDRVEKNVDLGYSPEDIRGGANTGPGSPMIWRCSTWQRPAMRLWGRARPASSGFAGGA